MQRKIQIVLGKYNTDGRIGQVRKRSLKEWLQTKKVVEEWYTYFLLQQSSAPIMTLVDFWDNYKADKENYHETGRVFNK